MAAGPYHDDYQQFDTMNLSTPQLGGEAAAQFNRMGAAAPHHHHAAAAGQFDTMNVSAPHRSSPGAADTAAAQFNTANLGVPVKVHGGGGGGMDAHERAGSGYGAAPTPPQYNQHSGQSPMMMEMQSGGKKGNKNGGRLPMGLVITMLALRIAAAVSLIIALAVLASDSQTINSVTVSYTLSTNTKYALAASIVGAVYSIYELVSVLVRLITGSLLLPGTASLWVSYIGDQVMIVLLLTSASAATGFIKSMHEIQISTDDTRTYCDILTTFCGQGAGAVAMIYIGFVCVATSLVFSSYCFYKGRT